MQAWRSDRRLQPVRGDLRPRDHPRRTARVTGVRGNPDDPLSRGHICPKGVAIADIHADPDRLRRPVRRVGDGRTRRGRRSAGTRPSTWSPTAWPRAINEHGRDAVGDLPRQPQRAQPRLADPRHRDGEVAAAPATGSAPPRSTSSPTSCVAHLMFGHQLLLPVPDIDRTSYFLVFGANPMASNGSLMTVPDFPNRLRELKARGGRMVVFDPRRTETAKVATEHHFVRPGHRRVRAAGDAPACWSPRGWPRPPSYVDGLDAVEAAVADFTPERAEPVSGVPADDDPPDRPRVRGRRRRRGLRPDRRLDPRVRLGVPVGGPAAQPAHRQPRPRRRRDVHHARPSTSSARGLIGRGHHDVWRSRVRGLPEFGGELPVAALREEIETPGEGQIRALLTLAGNPVLSTPDGARLDRGAGRPRLHGGGRHLPQRDHPARRRDPAADHGARARPLRPGLPRARGAQHRAVHPGGASPSRTGRAARLGDLPRARAAHAAARLRRSRR